MLILFLVNMNCIVATLWLSSNVVWFGQLDSSYSGNQVGMVNVMPHRGQYGRASLCSSEEEHTKE